MQRIGAFEAKNRLSELLNLVENGEEIMITKHGRPVARLVPAEPVDRARVAQTLAELRERRERLRLGGLDWKKLRDEGRR